MEHTPSPHRPERNRAAATALALLLAAFGPARAQTVPLEAGQWALTSTMSGLPSGPTTSSANVCLSAAQLAQAPAEQWLLDAASAGAAAPSGSAAAREGGPGGPPKCKLEGLAREGERGRWNAVCAGPRGELRGRGESRLAAQSAELSQQFELRRGPMTLTLNQALQARRTGACT